MLVWVLFHETNTGHSDDSDGYVEAIYATEEAAEAAKLAAIRRLIAEGDDVYWNPDTGEEGPADWNHDFRVLPLDVRTEPPAPDAFEHTCPKCGARPGLRCKGPNNGGRDKPHVARVRLAETTARPRSAEAPRS